MRAEEPSTSDDHVPGQGKARAEPVPAAQSRGERGDEEERRTVHAQPVDRTDPAFGAGHLHPVGGAGERRRHGRQHSEPGQEHRSVTRLGPPGEISSRDVLSQHPAVTSVSDGCNE